MTELQGAFVPNLNEVAAKVIDGELIIIRLSDGTYYSMDDVGAYAWELLAAGNDVSATVEVIARFYGEARDRVRSDIGAMISDLLAEGLVVPAPEGAEGPTETPPPAPSAYEPPNLHIYRDMGNLLALDPPTPGIDDLAMRKTSVD